MKKVVIFSQNKKRADLILKQFDSTGLNTNILLFTEVVEALLFFVEEKANSLIIDVDSPACDNLKFVRILNAIVKDVPIVFISESGRYALEGYDLGIFDYFKLPLNKERIISTFTKIKKQETLIQNRHIYIKTFGTFEMTVGGKYIPWKNSKTKELLAFLIDGRGADVSSEKIIKTLWADMDTKKRAGNYHTTLHNLRKKLNDNGIGHILSGTRGSQRVNANTFKCDLYEFEGYALGDSINSYKKAFELYKGRYLENNDYDWSRFTKLRIDIQFEQICSEIGKHYERE